LIVNFVNVINFDEIFRVTMKIVLDIKDNKVEYILHLLQQYSFVKINPVADKKAAKAQFLKGLGEAVNEVNLDRAGKIHLKSAKEFLNEL